MLRAYECWVAGTDHGHTIVHASSAGKAKSEFFLDAKEPWPDLRFTQVRVLCVGAPQTSEDFLRTARYRGVPFARIGMKVIVGDAKCGEWTGRIAGKNSSANFEIAFEDGPHAGHTLNCHPNWMMRYFAEDGTELFVEAQCENASR
jgi:hypothetical protein